MAAGFSFVTEAIADAVMAMFSFAGMGLYSFALHRVIQATVLDVVEPGTESATVGLNFGMNGILGALFPFLGYLVIDSVGGYGAVHYFAGTQRVVSALLRILAPMNLSQDQALAHYIKILLPFLQIDRSTTWLEPRALGHR